ncbi:MAG: hypothetical protein AAF629_14845 [Chloroflexota bacterium]
MPIKYYFTLLITSSLILLPAFLVTAQPPDTLDQFIYLPIILAQLENGEDPAPEPDDSHPFDLVDLIDHNVEAGIWTFEEGLIQTLQIFAREKSMSEIPGALTIEEPHATALGSMARDYIRLGGDEATKQELKRLLNVIIPNLANIEAYAEPVSDGNTTFSVTAQGEGDLDNCIDLWLMGFPTDLDTFPCFLFSEFEMNSHTYKLFYPKQWDLDGDSTKLHNTLLADRALRHTVEIYSDLGTMGDVTLIFSFDDFIEDDGEPNPDTRGAFFGNFVENTNACPIVIYPSAWMTTKYSLEQAIAHELFHCFQWWNLAPQQVPDFAVYQWWSEGTAEYFSNVAYPGINDEHYRLPTFNENSAVGSLVDMSYENWIFFQYFANQTSDTHLIDNLLRSLPTTAGTTIIDQAKALAQYNKIDMLFHQFGRDFLDGNIRDKNGELIPTDELPRVLTGKKSVLEFVEKGDKREKSAAFFVLARYLLRYDQAKQFTQNYKIDSALHSVKRRPFPNVLVGEWEPLKEQIKTKCASDTDYLLLLTAIDANKEKLKHFQSTISKMEDQPCSCYFEVALSGAVGGAYEGKAFFNTDLTYPLEIIGGDFLSPWAGTLAFNTYNEDLTGPLPMHLASFGDNDRMIILGLSNGSIVIEQNNSDLIRGSINATMNLASSDDGGTVQMTGNFRAARPFTVHGEACDAEWE